MTIRVRDDDDVNHNGSYILDIYFEDKFCRQIRDGV
jgi:hypothetical protein